MIKMLVDEYGCPGSAWQYDCDGCDGDDDWVDLKQCWGKIVDDKVCCDDAFSLNGYDKLIDFCMELERE